MVEEVTGVRVIDHALNARERILDSHKHSNLLIIVGFVVAAIGIGALGLLVVRGTAPVDVIHLFN